ERLGRDRRAAHDLAQRRVFEIRQPGAVLAFRQEQVPQPGRPRLFLQLLHHRRDLPARRRLVELPLEDALGRVDLALHELAHLRLKALHLVRSLEMHLPSPHYNPLSFGANLFAPYSSWPGLARPSTQRKTWIPGSSPGMTGGDRD